MRLQRIAVLSVSVLYFSGLKAFGQKQQPEVGGAPAKPSPGDIQKLVDQLGTIAYNASAATVQSALQAKDACARSRRVGGCALGPSKRKSYEDWNKSTELGIMPDE